MKVKELIELLQKEDSEKTIILQQDSEGNGYSPLAGLNKVVYVPDTGDAFREDDVENMIEEGYIDENSITESTIVLYPQ